MKKQLNIQEVTLSDDGIFLKDTLILPIAIREVNVFYNYSKSPIPTITCDYSIENVSLGIPNHFRFSYSPGAPSDSLKKLKDIGLEFKDKQKILSILFIIFNHFSQDSLPSMC